MLNKWWKWFIEKQNRYLFGITYEGLVDLNIDIIKKNDELIRLIDLLKNDLKQYKVEHPQIKGYISYNDVLKILKPHCSLNNIFLSDPVYAVTTMTEAKRFSEKSMIQTREYKKNTHDCENFSYALNGYWSDSLKSFCFGIAWTNTHAFNIMIDNKGKIWICEPQSNKWSRIEYVFKNKMYYPFRVVMI